MSKYDVATLTELREQVEILHRNAEAAEAARGKPGRDAAARVAAYLQVIALIDVRLEPCAFGDPLEPEHDHEACRDAAEPTSVELYHIVDLGGPDGGRYWRVTTGEPADHPDAQHAAVMARATGSVGCTYNGVKVAACPDPTKR